MVSGARIGWSWTGLVTMVSGVLASMLVPAGAVWAMPFDGVSPSSSGMPGADLVKQLLSWGGWVGLAVCGAAMVYGAATWRGMGSNSGRGVEGKSWVFAGAVGALLIGLAPTIVTMLFTTGSAG